MREWPPALRGRCRSIQHLQAEIPAIKGKELRHQPLVLDHDHLAAGGVRLLAKVELRGLTLLVEPGGISLSADRRKIAVHPSAKPVTVSLLPEDHVNIILFHPHEVEHPLARRDPRAVHLLEVLRRHAGDTFNAGVIDGPRGRGTIMDISADALRLAFAWGEAPPPLSPIHVIVGLPRPQTARDILRDVTALGVTALHFVITDKGEASYAGSSLWKSKEWRECVIGGAAQAFCTRLPEVTHGQTLAEAIARLPAEVVRLALDNYEASSALSPSTTLGGESVVIALGAERGWSAAERASLRVSGFTLVHLGPRVLRTETACIAAVALLKAQLNWR